MSIFYFFYITLLYMDFFYTTQTSTNNTSIIPRDRRGNVKIPSKKMQNFRVKFLEKYTRDRSVKHSQNYIDSETLFDFMDNNQDGLISKPEFRVIAKNVDDNYTPNDIDVLFNEFNTIVNKNILTRILFEETISLAEFKKFIWSDLNVTRFDAIIEKFNSLDKTNKGFITALDFLEHICFTFGIDANNDGKITLEEFKKYYTQLSTMYTSDDEFVKHLDLKHLVRVNNTDTVEI